MVGRTRRRFQYQAFTQAPFTSELIFVDKWFAPFSEPQRFKQGLAAYLQQALAYSESAQFPENVTVDRWLLQWEGPKRFKPGLLAANQLFYAAPPQPADLNVMGWFSPLSEPKRFKPELAKGLNPSFATGAHSLSNPYARGYVIT